MQAPHTIPSKNHCDSGIFKIPSKKITKTYIAQHAALPPHSQPLDRHSRAPSATPSPMGFRALKIPYCSPFNPPVPLPSRVPHMGLSTENMKRYNTLAQGVEAQYTPRPVGAVVRLMLHGNSPLATGFRRHMAQKRSAEKGGTTHEK